MSAVAVEPKKKSFIIVGPEMVRGRLTLHAMSALYYLPTRFRLVFAGNPKDQSFYNEVINTVDRFHLNNRVRFMYEVENPDAIITDQYDSDRRAVWGDSPEALASAILHRARM